jgi:hypothetical protein
MGWDRFQFYVNWLSWQSSEINPVEVVKDGKDFDRDMGFTD